MAIVIEVKAPSVTNASVVLEKMERILKMVDAQAKQATRSINRLGKAIKNLPNIPSGGSASPGANIPSTTGINRTGGGKGSVKAPPKLVDLNDPYNKYRWFNVQNKLSGGKFQGQRNAYLQQAFQQAQSGAMAGDPKMFARMNALSGPMAQLANNTPMNRVMQAVLTSRVGLGKGGAQIMPLVGRALAALGGGGGAAGGAGAAAGVAAALANPVGLVIAAIVATVAQITALGAAGMDAAQKLAKLGAGAYTNGASLDKAAAAQTLGALGINPAAIYGAIMQPGAARGMAGQMGINLTGGPFGNIDKVSAAMKVAEKVMNAGSEKAALRMANIFGDPELAKLWYLRPDQKKAFGDQSQVDPRMVKMGIQVDADKMLLAKRFENIVTRLEVLFIPIAKGIMWIMERILNFFDVVLKFFGLSNDKSAKEEATKANTEAINNNSRALKEFREVLGGGPRAQGALPKGVQGQHLSNPAYRAALATGVI